MRQQKADDTILVNNRQEGTGEFNLARAFLDRNIAEDSQTFEEAKVSKTLSEDSESETEFFAADQTSSKEMLGSFISGTQEGQLFANSPGKTLSNYSPLNLLKASPKSIEFKHENSKRKETSAQL